MIKHNPRLHHSYACTIIGTGRVRIGVKRKELSPVGWLQIKRFPSNNELLNGAQPKSSHSTVELAIHSPSGTSTPGPSDIGHIKMFTPLYIQLKYWFYPTGNTPAVNLLRDTPAAAIGQQDTVSALLLACGDPRNVLFSLWNRQGSGRFYNTANTQFYAQANCLFI